MGSSCSRGCRCRRLHSAREQDRGIITASSLRSRKTDHRLIARPVVTLTRVFAGSTFRVQSHKNHKSRQIWILCCLMVLFSPSCLLVSWRLVWPALAAVQVEPNWEGALTDWEDWFGQTGWSRCLPAGTGERQCVVVGC